MSIGAPWTPVDRQDWAYTTLRRVARIYAGGTPDRETSAYWENGTIPWLNSGAVNEPLITQPSEFITDGGLRESSAKWIRAGALVIALAGQGRTKGMVAQLGFDATCNQSMAAILPRGGLAPRFLFWWLSGHYSTLRGLAGGDLRDGLNLDMLGNIPVPVPPLGKQRAIADYLDRETARIDALIAAKERMSGLLDERWQGVLEDTIQDLTRRFGVVPMKFVCREIVVGIVITPSAWYADAGVPAIRGTNVAPGAISLDDVVFLTPEGHRLHPKSELRAGDVVVVRTGQAGSAAVVPPELDGANCIDLVIMRLMDRCLPEFLVHVLNSDWMQKHIAQHSVGTIQSHFNVGAASSVPVPRAPKEQQAEAVAVLAAEHARLASIVTCLKQQIALLRERRQALITGAVTGQVEVPVAA